MKIFLFLFLFLFCYLQPSSVLGAEFVVQSGESVFSKDQNILVDVFLNAEDEKINALDGTVSYSTNILELVEVRDGDSVVNFWVDKPDSSEAGVVTFSGITPGGIIGDKRLIITLIFRTKEVGEGRVSVQYPRTIKDDGLGTILDTSAKYFDFRVVANTELHKDSLEVVDNDPPESFLPEVGHSTELYDGKFFLAFSTTDKGVGVDKYEVKEGFFGDYKLAESPYVLENQSLDKKIYVKSVDRYGNERVVKVLPENYTRWYEHYVIFCILIVVVISSILLKKTWTRNVY